MMQYNARMSVRPGDAEPVERSISPIDRVAIFLDTNSRLVETAIAAVEGPSAQTLFAFNRARGIAVENMSLIAKPQFFRTDGDTQMVAAATGAMMNATVQLWETATHLRPDDPSNFDFDEEFQETAVAGLTSDDSSKEGRDAIKTCLAGLCNTYESSTQNLFEKVMSADSVVNYAFEVQQRAERRRHLIQFGGAAVAAFAGASAAIFIFGRKSK